MTYIGWFLILFGLFYWLSWVSHLAYQALLYNTLIPPIFIFKSKLLQIPLHITVFIFFFQIHMIILQKIRIKIIIQQLHVLELRYFDMIYLINVNKFTKLNLKSKNKCAETIKLKEVDKSTSISVSCWQYYKISELTEDMAEGNENISL